MATSGSLASSASMEVHKTLLEGELAGPDRVAIICTGTNDCLKFSINDNFGTKWRKLLKIFNNLNKRHIKIVWVPVPITDLYRPHQRALGNKINSLLRTLAEYHDNLYYISELENPSIELIEKTMGHGRLQRRDGIHLNQRAFKLLNNFKKKINFKDKVYYFSEYLKPNSVSSIV